MNRSLSWFQMCLGIYRIFFFFEVEICRYFHVVSVITLLLCSKCCGNYSRAETILWNQFKDLFITYLIFQIFFGLKTIYFWVGFKQLPHGSWHAAIRKAIRSSSSQWGGSLRGRSAAGRTQSPAQSKDLWKKDVTFLRILFLKLRSWGGL